MEDDISHCLQPTHLPQEPIWKRKYHNGPNNKPVDAKPGYGMHPEYTNMPAALEVGSGLFQWINIIQRAMSWSFSIDDVDYDEKLTQNVG